MVTLEAIQSKIAALQAKADAITSKETIKAVEQIRDTMDKHGLTIADLEAHLGGKRRGRPPAGGKAASVASKSKGELPPKYLNPKTGETWSGRGRPPSWIAGVKDRTKFLIDSNVASKSQTARTTAKTARADVRGTAAKTKGKLRAKYRDPKTGATWSGHARPPAWIKDVKDRSKYLIAGEAAAAAANSATASKAKIPVKNTSAVGSAGAHTGQRTGPQPAKYRDPKSGATWSGRGPAPTWLAAIKDRTRFLIEGAGAVTTKAGATNKANKPNAAGKSGAITKKAAAKRVVAKKTPVAKKAVATNNAAAKKAQAKDVASASNIVPAWEAAAPAAKKVVAKKAPAKKAVVRAVVATPDVAAAAPSVTA